MAESWEKLFASSVESKTRLPWFRIDRFLTEMGEVAQEAGLEDTDLVHMGGNGVYNWMLYILGEEATTHFRGTYDVDLVTFNPGRVNYLLDLMQDRGNIQSWKKHPAYGFLDKDCYTVNWEVSNGSGTPESLVLDVYAPRSTEGEIHFNDRTLRPGELILDPPVRLWELEKDRGMVVVPSLRDLFLLKMDIVLSSRSGLREKDETDVIMLVAMTEKTGVGFEDLLRSLVTDDGIKGYRFEDTQQRLQELRSLIFKSKMVDAGFRKRALQQIEKFQE